MQNQVQVEFTPEELAVSTAESELDDAKSALQAAELQILNVRKEKEALSERIRASAADDLGGLARLAQQRATLQAQVEALEMRIEDRRADVSGAQQRLKVAETDLNKVVLAEKTTRARILEAEFNERIESFAAEMAERGLTLAKLVKEANRLEYSIKAAEDPTMDVGRFRASLDIKASRHGGQLEFVLETLPRPWKEAESRIQPVRHLR